LFPDDDKESGIYPMKINHCMLLALGGLAASFSVSAKMLDTFETFLTPQVNALGFNLTSSGATANDRPAGDALGGVATDTDFAVLSRRASLLRTGGSGSPTFSNAGGGTATWSNSQTDTSTATLRYVFDVEDFGSQNITAIDFLLPNPVSGVDLTIQVFTSGSSPASPGMVGIQGVFPDAFSGVASTFNAASLTTSIGGGTAGVWNTARQIIFTMTSTTPGVVLEIEEISFLRTAEVPEAKTMIPALGLTGLVGFVAWKRRKSN
jgi:hypothetical protein